LLNLIVIFSKGSGLPKASSFTWYRFTSSSSPRKIRDLVEFEDATPRPHNEQTERVNGASADWFSRLPEDVYNRRAAKSSGFT
jgi:hypothetical protein